MSRNRAFTRCCKTITVCYFVRKGFLLAWSKVAKIYNESALILRKGVFKGQGKELLCCLAPDHTNWMGHCKRIQVIMIHGTFTVACWNDKVSLWFQLLLPTCFSCLLCLHSNSARTEKQERSIVRERGMGDHYVYPKVPRSQHHEESTWTIASDHWLILNVVMGGVLVSCLNVVLVLTHY